VLLVDLDPQGNATTGAGVDKRALAATVYQVLLGERRIADVRMASPTGGFDLVPANRELAGAEIELVELPEREMRLKDALAEALRQMRTAITEVAPDYDFILLDCPPSLSLLTLNGLCAADSVLIPMQCEYYALEGLSDLVQTIKKVRAHLNPVLEAACCARVRPRRSRIAAGWASRQKFCRTIVPRTCLARRCGAFGAPSTGRRRARRRISPRRRILADERAHRRSRLRGRGNGGASGTTTMIDKGPARSRCAALRRRQAAAGAARMRSTACEAVKYSNQDGREASPEARAVDQRARIVPVLVRPIGGAEISPASARRRPAPG
jgi:chromosome partitioning protein